MNLEEPRTNRIINGGTIFQAGFILISFILAALVVSGFSFTAETFKNPAFYISSTISFIMMMTTFQITKNATYINGKKDETSAYYNIVLSYSELLKKIEENKLEPLVEKAVQKVNHQNKIKMINYLLQRRCNKVTYENYETLTKEEIKAHAKAAGYSLLGKYLLFNVIYRLRKNKIKMSKINYLDILIDAEYESGFYHPEEMRMNITKFNISESMKRAWGFMLSTTLVNSLIFNGFSQDFLVSIFSQGFLILSAAVAGVFSGNRQLLYRKQIINNRVVFINTHVLNNNNEVTNQNE